MDLTVQFETDLKQPFPANEGKINVYKSTVEFILQIKIQLKRKSKLLISWLLQKEPYQISQVTSFQNLKFQISKSIVKEII